MPPEPYALAITLSLEETILMTLLLKIYRTRQKLQMQQDKIDYFDREIVQHQKQALLCERAMNRREEPLEDIPYDLLQNPVLHNQQNQILQMENQASYTFLKKKALHDAEDQEERQSRKNLYLSGIISLISVMILSILLLDLIQSRKSSSFPEDLDRMINIQGSGFMVYGPLLCGSLFLFFKTLLLRRKTALKKAKREFNQQFKETLFSDKEPLSSPKTDIQDQSMASALEQQDSLK